MSSLFESRLFVEPPLQAARHRDQELRVERLRGSLRKLHRLRGAAAVLFLSLPLILVVELQELMLLTNQGTHVPNPMVAGPALLLALAFLGERWARGRLQAVGPLLGEALKSGEAAPRESRPLTKRRLVAYAVVPALFILVGWEGWRLKRPERELQRAASSGDLAAARWALSLGARVNVRDGEGYPPLAVALRGKRWALAELLLRHGADPMFGEPRSALHQAMSASERKAFLLMFPYLRTRRFPDSALPDEAVEMVDEGDGDLPPYLFHVSRAELSVATGDVELIRKELRTASNQVIQERLVDVAKSHGTLPELRKAQRLNASQR